MAAIHDCLLRKRPPPSRCTAEWMQYGCLRSNVPEPHAAVAPCFRCCLLNATALLRANSHFWRRVWLTESRDPWGRGTAGKAPGAPGKLLGFDEDDSVLLGSLSGARYADAGATYSNASIVRAPLWKRHPTPSYVSIYGWSSASALALRSWSRMGGHARSQQQVLYTPGAQELPTPHDRHLLGDHRLREWWVTNPAISHPRLSAFPRGVKSTARWHRALSLPLVKSLDSPGRVRRTLLFCSCMTLSSHAQRAVKMDALRANGFACEPNGPECGKSAAGLDPYIRQLFEARFTASPRGRGMQNHRDFEALYAGSIPLVDYHPQLSELYAELPVVGVRNWSLVNESFLEDAWTRMRSRGQWRWSKLYFPYWLDRLGISGPRAHDSRASRCADPLNASTSCSSTIKADSDSFASIHRRRPQQVKTDTRVHARLHEQDVDSWGSGVWLKSLQVLRSLQRRRNKTKSLGTGVAVHAHAQKPAVSAKPVAAAGLAADQQAVNSRVRRAVNSRARRPSLVLRTSQRRRSSLGTGVAVAKAKAAAAKGAAKAKAAAAAMKSRAVAATKFRAAKPKPTERRPIKTERDLMRSEVQQLRSETQSLQAELREAQAMSPALSQRSDSVRLGVALAFATPASIDKARGTWLGNYVGMFLGERTDAARQLWHVPMQEEYLSFNRQRFRCGGKEGNHEFDNRPLALIRIANATIVRHHQLEWLVIGDEDTCFDLKKLRGQLARFDPKQKLFLGSPDCFGTPEPSRLCPCTPDQILTRQHVNGSDCDGRSVTWACEQSGCCALDYSRSYRQQSECNLDAARWMGKKRICGTYRQPGQWPFGGAGYILSRGLLDSLDKAAWRRCEDTILIHGGDVRIATCVYNLVKISLTALPGLGSSLSAHKSSNCSQWASTAPDEPPAAPNLEVVTQAAIDVRPHFGTMLFGVGFCAQTARQHVDKGTVTGHVQLLPS